MGPREPLLQNLEAIRALFLEVVYKIPKKVMMAILIILNLEEILLNNSTLE